MTDVMVLMAIVAGIGLGMGWLFHRANLKLKVQHLQRTASLEQQQRAQLEQMCLRDKRLNGYRFIDRNLKEVLVPQSAISL